VNLLTRRKREFSCDPTQLQHVAGIIQFSPSKIIIWPIFTPEWRGA